MTRLVRMETRTRSVLGDMTVSVIGIVALIKMLDLRSEHVGEVTRCCKADNGVDHGEH
jgi:hypothetical protein